MHLLYTVLLLLLILLTLPLWLYRYYTTPKYRGTVGERLGRLPQELVGHTTPCFWIHAVSVGEALAAQGVVEGLRAAFPGYRVVFSTVTKTGRQVAHEKISGIDHLIYLPLDLPWIVHSVTEQVRPRFLVVMETELWPNLFAAMGRAGIPIMVVNGRLSPRSFVGYQRFRWAMARFLAPVRLMAMQSQADAQRMRIITTAHERVVVTGNIKYDQALRTPDPEKMAEVTARIGVVSEPIWLAASTHPGEEEGMLDALLVLRAARPTLRLILVPRHPERADAVARLMEPRGVGCQRLSTIQGGWTAPVLLVDQVGWLMRLYGLAQVAVIGGSFIPHGGQNLLEPAAWGIPMIFGPHMFNFKDATQQMLELQGGLQIADASALPNALAALLDDPSQRQQMGARARQVVENNAGALQRTLAAVVAVARNTGET